MPSAAVVVASNRPDRLAQFLRARAEELANATIHVVHDGPEPPPPDAGGVRHHSWPTIDADLGEHAWIIPRGTGCVRSYGCLVGWGRSGSKRPAKWNIRSGVPAIQGRPSRHSTSWSPRFQPMTLQPR